jgi:integrase
MAAINFLTDAQIRAQKPPAKELKLSDGGGMYLLCTPTGLRSFRMKYRIDGKERKLTFGEYPAVSLAEARKKRDAARELIAGKKDPMAERRDEAEHARIAASNSFEVVARAWWEHWKTLRTSHHADYVLRRLEADVFPRIGSRPITSLKTPDIVAVAVAVQERGALDIAKRHIQTCGQIFRYAIAHGFVELNPVSEIKPAEVLVSRKEKNHARIDRTELPELMRRIDGYRGGNLTRFAMRLLATTFVRTSELIEAPWSEINWTDAEWRIPAERMKMKVPHIVPLSVQAMTMLRSLHTLTGDQRLMFPGTRDPSKPMSNNTILKALEIMGYKYRMTGHGFRGVASTALHEMGFAHEHIEIQLAHIAQDDVSAAYNWAEYLGPRRKIMQHWSDYLDEIVATENVVPLRRVA